MIDPRYLQAAELVFASLHTPCREHCEEEHVRLDIKRIAQALERAAQGQEAL